MPIAQQSMTTCQDARETASSGVRKDTRRNSAADEAESKEKPSETKQFST
ncbi:hypothetical protein DY000_02040372 [Brassica cretica]|uniref:Uncharacterized protein n=1 Tax=Brassica cretica TaxID=69181 RepID=A0ABQ7BJQ5_BRACR|nr:hypothetical protein DY000_02040372 [Brassica cretica]